MARRGPRSAFVLPAVGHCVTSAARWSGGSAAYCSPRANGRPRAAGRAVRGGVTMQFGDGGRPGGSGGPRLDPQTQKRIRGAFQTTRAFFSGTTGQSILWLLLIYLVVTGKAGFIFDSLFYLFIIGTIVPTVAFFAFRWFLKRSVVSGTCSNCGAEVQGFKGREGQCLQCGTKFYADDISAPGAKAGFTDASKATVDVEATVEDI